MKILRNNNTKAKVYKNQMIYLSYREHSGRKDQQIQTRQDSIQPKRKMRE